VRIAIDARVAAEVPAGRGRYVREVLRQLARLDGDWTADLFARRAWDCPDPDGRFTWRTISGSDRSWPLRILPHVRNHDVVLATSSFLLAAAAPAPSVPVVWDFAAFDQRFGAASGAGFERATAPLAVRRARHLIAISHATAAELETRFPRARGRVTVAHPSADEAFAAQEQPGDETVRTRLGLDRPYVLSVGTLEPRKNLPRLIDAFVRLPEHVRGDHELVLAGARGWELEATFAAVAGHERMVRTLGFVPDDDLSALYRGATVFCYPSLYEGFGIPVLEALRCGVPVLTSNTSSMPEVGGDAALYVDPESTESIADGLAALLGNGELRAGYSAAGPKRAGTFSWAQSARTILDVLLHAGGAPRR
jgi:glycosyltransferase involved in cell wall biosynthesis